MRHFIPAVVLSSSLLLAGCAGLGSLQPVARDKPPDVDPSLAGLWAFEKDGGVFRVEAEGPVYRIFYTEDISSTMRLEARLLSASGPMLLDIEPAGQEPLQMKLHAVVRVWPEGDRLRIAFLDSDWLKERARAELPVIDVQEEGNPLLVHPGAAFRKLILQYADDARSYREISEAKRLR